jgi:hypothetical protein
MAEPRIVFEETHERRDRALPPGSHAADLASSLGPNLRIFGPQVLEPAIHGRGSEDEEKRDGERLGHGPSCAKFLAQES